MIKFILIIVCACVCVYISLYIYIYIYVYIYIYIEDSTSIPFIAPKLSEIHAQTAKQRAENVTGPDRRRLCEPGLGTDL